MLTWNRGDTSKVVAISVMPDAVEENDEALTLRLSDAVGTSVAKPFGVATILDDDTAPPPGLAATYSGYDPWENKITAANAFQLQTDGALSCSAILSSVVAPIWEPTRSILSPR